MEAQNIFSPSLHGICKDCGNGTLNNSTNPAFQILRYIHDDMDVEYLICGVCGSRHLDIVWEQQAFLDASDL